LLASLAGVPLATLAREAPHHLHTGPLVQARVRIALRNVELAEVARVALLAGAGEGGVVVDTLPAVLTGGGGAPVDLGTGGGGVTLISG